MYYISYVFAMAGLKGNAGLVSASIQYVINVLMTVPALLFIDRWGRRKPLLIGCTLMFTWMMANGSLMIKYGQPAPLGGLNGIPQESWQISGPAAKAVIACTYLFVASFAPTMGPVSWIYPPELYPLRVRGKAVALATSVSQRYCLFYSAPSDLQTGQLGFQLRLVILCAARVCQHQSVRRILPVRQLFVHHDHPYLLPVSRDSRQDSRGS